MVEPLYGGPASRHNLGVDGWQAADSAPGVAADDTSESDSTSHWLALSTPEQAEQRRALLEEATRFWATPGHAPWPHELGAAGLWFDPEPPTIRYALPTARRLARLVAERAPCPMAVGRQRQDTPAALRTAKGETQVDLSSSRVRVGVTRGHLLEVVISVPLDVEGSQEALEDAAGTLVESLIGEEQADDWVASVDVDRTARTRGLRVADARSGQAENFSVWQLGELLTRGIDGIRRELGPLPALDPTWTALEIPGGTGIPQGDRRFASSRHPEPLKCALEGMPFSSCRFCQSGWVFVWFAWTSPPGPARVQLKQRLEAVCEGWHAAGKALFCGTGFGARRDFLDLWLPPSAAQLKGLATELVHSAGLPIEARFYDLSAVGEGGVQLPNEDRSIPR